MTSNLFVIIIGLFTSAGPAYMATVTDNEPDCKARAAAAASLTNQKIPGPNGDEVTVYSAEGKCEVFRQLKSASN